MRITRDLLEQQVQAINEALHGAEYFLEVMNYEAYGINRFRINNKQGSGMPLCTWDRMPASEMYQYLRGAQAAILSYRNLNK